MYVFGDFGVMNVPIKGMCAIVKHAKSNQTNQSIHVELPNIDDVIVPNDQNYIEEINNLQSLISWKLLKIKDR